MTDVGVYLDFLAGYSMLNFGHRRHRRRGLGLTPVPLFLGGHSALMELTLQILDVPPSMATGSHEGRGHQVFRLPTRKRLAAYPELAGGDASWHVRR
jgi:hypothetical protein